MSCPGLFKEKTSNFQKKLTVLAHYMSGVLQSYQKTACSINYFASAVNHQCYWETRNSVMCTNTLCTIILWATQSTTVEQYAHVESGSPPWDPTICQNWPKRVPNSALWSHGKKRKKWPKSLNEENKILRVQFAQI